MKRKKSKCGDLSCPFKPNSFHGCCALQNAFTTEHQTWQARHQSSALFTDESRFTLSTCDRHERVEKPWRLLSRLQHHPAWRVWQWVSDGVGRHVLLCVGECHTVLGMWAEVPLMDVRTAWSLCPTSNPLVLVLHVSRGAPPIPPHTQQQILSLRMVSPPHSWHRMLLCNLNMPQVIFPKRADWHLRSLTDFVF